MTPKQSASAKPACKDTWKLWRRALKLFAHSSGILKTKLGKWLLPHDKLRRQWTWYYSPSEDCMLMWDGGWYRYEASHTQFFSGRLFDNLTCTNPGDAPADAYPADAAREWLAAALHLPMAG